MNNSELVPIGVMAKRTGLAVSAIRLYEDKGLVRSERTSDNQRRFRRSDIRRLSFILIAQRLGLSLPEIEQAMTRLPEGRTPSISD
jgi:MerR family redox-sensitive transcriptional activator SoxR